MRKLKILLVALMVFFSMIGCASASKDVKATIADCAGDKLCEAEAHLSSCEELIELNREAIARGLTTGLTEKELADRLYKARLNVAYQKEMKDTSSFTYKHAIELQRIETLRKERLLDSLRAIK
jgi:hypothetical protein